jgi:hypothetical protein
MEILFGKEEDLDFPGWHVIILQGRNAASQVQSLCMGKSFLPAG